MLFRYIVFFLEARDHTAPTLLTPGFEEKQTPRGVGRSKEYTLVVIDEKTFKIQLHKQMSEMMERFLSIYSDWEGIDKRIEPSVRPGEDGKTLEALWTEGQRAEKNLNYPQALRLYERILHEAPDSEWAGKAKERISEIEAQRKKAGPENR